MAELAGGCVCGAVRFSTTGLPSRITICHCTWCQRRTGTAFGTECVFPVEEVKIDGEALRFYRHYSDESGRWIEQDFCSNCGTNIGLRLEAVPAIRSLSIGSFDDTSWVDTAGVTIRHVYARSQIGVVAIPDGAEIFDTHFRP